MSKLLDRLGAAVVSAHRFVFISATAVLAVGTSNVADDSSDTASWLLVVGSGIVMFIADVFSDIDRASEALAASSHTERDHARKDLFKARARRSSLGWLALGLLLIAIGLLWEPIREVVCDLTDRL